MGRRSICPFPSLPSSVPHPFNIKPEAGRKPHEASPRRCPHFCSAQTKHAQANTADSTLFPGWLFVFRLLLFERQFSVPHPLSLSIICSWSRQSCDSVVTQNSPKINWKPLWFWLFILINPSSILPGTVHSAEQTNFSAFYTYYIYKKKTHYILKCMTALACRSLVSGEPDSSKLFWMWWPVPRHYERVGVALQVWLVEAWQSSWESLPVHFSPQTGATIQESTRTLDADASIGSVMDFDGWLVENHWVKQCQSAFWEWIRIVFFGGGGVDANIDTHWVFDQRHEIMCILHQTPCKCEEIEERWLIDMQQARRCPQIYLWVSFRPTHTQDSKCSCFRVATTHDPLCKIIVLRQSQVQPWAWMVSCFYLSTISRNPCLSVVEHMYCYIHY